MNRMLLHFLIPGCLLLLMPETQADEHNAESVSRNRPEAGFLQENAQAMDRMMAGMDIRPAGNVDEDFVAMMAPHHQGAMDMAMAELRYGSDPRLKRIAQEIIVTQQQEIVAMYQVLGKPLPAAVAAPDQILSSAAPSD
jgi:uncharacterized protein (DUF305 family)